MISASKRASAVLLVLIICGFANAQETKPYAQQKDVVYSEVHGTGLLMDVFTPTGAKNGLAIVDVASGAWHSDRGKIGDHMQAKFYDIFCGKGYTVFAVRPGSRSGYTALEMVAHVKRGIRYVKAHAAEYGIDPARIGLTGASAGGHLASLTTVTAEDGKPDAKNELERFDTRVAAVGVFFPPTDFLDWAGKPADFAKLGDLLFRGGAAGHAEAEVLEQARKISPALAVSAGLPPFLLIHGDADPLVPLQQSQHFVEALKAAGVPVELIVKPGGGHPWLTIPEEVVVLADWFDKQLAPKVAAK